MPVSHHLWGLHHPPGVLDRLGDQDEQQLFETSLAFSVHLDPLTQVKHSLRFPPCSCTSEGDPVGSSKPEIPGSAAPGSSFCSPMTCCPSGSWVGFAEATAGTQRGWGCTRPATISPREQHGMAASQPRLHFRGCAKPEHRGLSSGQKQLWSVEQFQTLLREACHQTSWDVRWILKAVP